MGTIVVLAILILIVAVIVRSMIKKKQNGQCISCDCGCAGCTKCVSTSPTKKK